MVINKNKIVAVTTAMALSFLSVMNFTSSADNGSLKYVKYNAKTGTYLGSYTLNAMPSSDNSRSLFGVDTRVVDWSKSGVVKLMTSTNYAGTGFVVGEHTIATAGHCVKEKKITEILLFDSSGNVTLKATPVEAHYLKAYDDVSTTENDYALITVKQDLSDYMCFNLGAPTDKANNHVVRVTGFPEDHNNHNTHSMYTGSGGIKSVSEKIITHNVDTNGGNSGSPVYYSETYDGKTFYSVAAINTAHTDNENIGPRITFDLLHFYNNNSNISY